MASYYLTQTERPRDFVTRASNSSISYIISVANHLKTADFGDAQKKHIQKFNFDAFLDTCKRDIIFSSQIRHKDAVFILFFGGVKESWRLTPRMQIARHNQDDIICLGSGIPN